MLIQQPIQERTDSKFKAAVYRLTIGFVVYPTREEGLGHLGWCNGLQVRLAKVHEWIRVLLGAPFIRLCDTSKEKSLLNYHL